MEPDAVEMGQAWRTTPGDTSDEEWELIADLVAPYWTPGSMGRPVKVDRRRVVDAIFYVAAMGCQWRALPDRYPNWNTVHRYRLLWSKDGTWERIAERLAAAERMQEGRDAEPPAGVVDTRSVRVGTTVSKKSNGAGKKINGRKTFGIVDTLGLLVTVVVVAASISDNVGGIAVPDRARQRSARFAQLWCDSGFKSTVIEHCRNNMSASRWCSASIRPVQSTPQALDGRTHLAWAQEQSTSPGRRRG